MQLLKSASIVPLFVFALAAPALAQQPPAPVQSPLRGYLVAGAGTSTGAHTAQTSPTFTAEIGDHVTSDIQVYVTLAYSDNVMSADARTQLAQVSRDLTAFSGTPWNFQGRDRAYSLTGGIKYVIPASTLVRPYVGAGLGVINVERKIREQSRGDLTSAFLTEFGVSDGVVDITQADTTRPLGELGAGVGIVVGPAYLDFGYRWRKGFHTENRIFEFSQFIAAAGVKF